MHTVIYTPLTSLRGNSAILAAPSPESWEPRPNNQIGAYFRPFLVIHLEQLSQIGATYKSSLNHQVLTRSERSLKSTCHCQKWHHGSLMGFFALITAYLLAHLRACNKFWKFFGKMAFMTHFFFYLTLDNFEAHFHWSGRLCACSVPLGSPYSPYCDK